MDLTGDGADGERRRAGDAAANGGCGRTGAVAGLCSKGEGRVRREIERGQGEMLPAQGIGAALTEGGESTAADGARGGGNGEGGRARV